MKKTDKLKQRPWQHLNYPWRAIDHSGWEFYCLVEPNIYDNIWLGESTDKRGQLFSEAVPYWKETKQSFEEYQNLTNHENQRNPC